MQPYEHLRSAVNEHVAGLRQERQHDRLIEQARRAGRTERGIRGTLGLVLIHLGERLRGEVWTRADWQPGRASRVRGSAAASFAHPSLCDDGF
jgi:hypothetical protein